jgi:tetratricopeptide (TPR) repeat protein
MKNHLFGIAVLLPLFASAQSSDAELAALLKDRKAIEVETLANARIAKNASDEMAIWYLANVSTNDKTKREIAIAKVEVCIAALPKSAKCHHAMGRLYGAVALSSGPLDMMKYASRIKDEFLLAVELEPGNFDARRDLNQYYLQAPGIAGGSVRKAVNNAEEMGKLNPVAGKLMRSDVHIYEKEFDQAEALLIGIKPIGEEQTTNLTQGWVLLGFALIGDKQLAKAQALFERLIAVEPNNATLHFGLGRVHLEANSLDAAIASMERALKLDSKLTAHYRLGIAYQQKGDKPKAIAALQQFLTYVPSGKAADDAKKRLAELKSAG